MGCRVEAVERGTVCVGGRKCGVGKGEERVGGCGTEASLKELTGRQGVRKGRGGAGGKAGKEEGVTGRRGCLLPHKPIQLTYKLTPRSKLGISFPIPGPSPTQPKLTPQLRSKLYRCSITATTFQCFCIGPKPKMLRRLATTSARPGLRPWR